MATRTSQDSNLNGEIRAASIGIKRETSSGILEVFGENNLTPQADSQSSDLDKRPGKVSSRPDSRSCLGRSTPTSTKQISLQTVRRKNNSEDYIQVLDLETNTEREKSLNERLEKLNLSGRNSRNFPRDNSSQELTKDKERSKHDEASSEDDDEDEDDEDEKPKAPNELFMEFLTCVMNKDYPTAKKLCRMILIYEPQHEEALKFQSLIEEKILLDEEPDVSDSEEEGRESGHELDSGESDDSDDDSGNTSSNDSDSSEEDDSRPSTVDTVDSGITSAASISD